VQKETEILVIGKRKARKLLASGDAKEVEPVVDKHTGILFQTLYWTRKDLHVHYLLRLPDDSYCQAPEDQRRVAADRRLSRSSQRQHQPA